MTPAMASLAVAEIQYVFDVTSFKLMFPVHLEELKGEVPQIPDCLPSGLDKINDFRVYYQHSENLILETYYFDLSDLYLFTSSVTKSVTIKADTIVLSQEISPLSFPLNIFARKVVLASPLYSFADFAYASPQSKPEFYQYQHQVGLMNGVTVEFFQHGYITVALLQSDACLSAGAPDLSKKFEAVISVTALEFTLFCGNNLVEGDTHQQEVALGIASWIKNITTNVTDSEIFSVNQLACDLEKKKISFVDNTTIPDFVPYISLLVYKPMLDALKENLKLFWNAQLQLQDKLERNANRLFDMTISFEERKSDLEFIRDNSASAVQEAQNTLGSEIQKLNDLRIQTDGVCVVISTVNEHFVSTHNSLEQSYNTLQSSIQKKLKNMWLRRCGSFFKGLFGVFTGKAGAGDVVDGVMGVGDYKRELKEAQEKLTDSMLKMNELMDDVEVVVDILDGLPPPPAGESRNWTAIFPTNEPLLALVRQQVVSKYEWEIVDDNNNIVLDDEDMKKLDGTSDFQMNSGLMKTDGQDLSTNMISFAKLILDIRDEEENLKIAELAVSQGEDRLKDVDEMLSDTETTEDNYKEKLVEQNLVVMQLMLNLYHKTRKDMAFISAILKEFCQAYFYTFFLECPEDLRPSPFDSFEQLLYKINQLQYEALDDIGTLDPPPQPFSKNFLVSDQKLNCTVGSSECPITTLQQDGQVKIDLSEWWGEDLQDKDRVRVDKVRFYLRDTGEDFVVIHVFPPAIFNDTYEGQVYSFIGHSSQCLIMYEDYNHLDMASASYQTDCSTHESYDQFYSRTTPFGSYALTVAGDGVTKGATAIEVLVEGSWIPRIGIENFDEMNNNTH